MGEIARPSASSTKHTIRSLPGGGGNALSDCMSLSSLSYLIQAVMLIHLSLSPNSSAWMMLRKRSASTSSLVRMEKRVYSRSTPGFGSRIQECTWASAEQASSGVLATCHALLEILQPECQGGSIHMPLPPRLNLGHWPLLHFHLLVL